MKKGVTCEQQVCRDQLHGHCHTIEGDDSQTKSIQATCAEGKLFGPIFGFMLCLTVGDVSQMKLIRHPGLQAWVTSNRTLPVSSRVTTCHVCCRMTTLPGTVIHAMTAQMQCMVPLYTMMMSVVSVRRKSLTTIRAHAPNAA